MKIGLKLFIACSITLISLNSNSAGIKKWVDDKGNVFYGDTPPRHIQSQSIRTNKRPSKLGKPLPRLSNPGISNIPSSSKKSPVNNEKLEVSQAKEACENAKNDQRVIQSSSRVKLRSADGSTRYMTKEEIQQRLDNSQNDIDKFCN